MRGVPVGSREMPAIGIVGMACHVGEYLGPIAVSHRGSHLVGAAAEGRLAAGCEQQHLIAHGEVRQRMRDNDDRAPRVGESTQRRHDLPVECRIEAGRRLIEDEVKGR